MCGVTRASFNSNRSSCGIEVVAPFSACPAFEHAEMYSVQFRELDQTGDDGVPARGGMLEQGREKMNAPIDPRTIARALGGEISGRQILAPGPGHSRLDRSLSIRFDPAAPGGFVVHSFAGDDPFACKDYVRERLGLPEWEPGDEQDCRIDPLRRAR